MPTSIMNHMIPGVSVLEHEPLWRHTRFGIGGPADCMLIAHNVSAFEKTLDQTRERGGRWVVIGGGTNLVVADSGFRGTVLKLASSAIRRSGNCVIVEAGAVLQDLVDFTVAQGLRGLETMTGIPGWVGAAVYGNAGAYGHSLSERVSRVHFRDGRETRVFENAACEFRYRESIFKSHREWIILSCELALEPADHADLARTASEILTIRNQKYPPMMKCAGSIFKNLLWAELPETVQTQIPSRLVRQGKVPAAWFLEQAGAKGIRRGDIQVATYHANLIYNDGEGTARDLVAVIRLLKQTVKERFGIGIEEEVQYIGDFPSLPEV